MTLSVSTPLLHDLVCNNCMNEQRGGILECSILGMLLCYGDGSNDLLFEHKYPYDHGVTEPTV